MADNNEKTGLWLGGMPWLQAIVAIILCAIPMYFGFATGTLLGILASCIALAVVFNEIGERVPIWNTYIGGGLLATFFGVAIMKQFNLIPEKVLTNITVWISGDDIPVDGIDKGIPSIGTNFLEVFIVLLIVGSVLALERDILLRSFAGYVPTILGGLFVAMLFGIVCGAIFGIKPADTIIKYTLPIMGGGNGAGAVPLSQIYEQITGDSAANYYSFAIIVLTIANLFCIIASAGLNALGQKIPALTGDKKTLIRKGGTITRDDTKVKVTTDDLMGAVLLACACYSFGLLMSKRILPKILGAPIHQYAYMIVFVVILAASGLIPASVRAGAKRLQAFMSGGMAIVIMVGMGADFSIGELFRAVAPQNIIMALIIVIGAIIGSGLVGYLVGFYPIDAAITAGLCMANRGGSGDLACLGAADRMELMAYSQLSSRLGGGIVLIVGSFIFSFFL